MKKFRILKDKIFKLFKVQRRILGFIWINCGRPQGQSTTAYTGIYHSYSEAEIAVKKLCSIYKKNDKYNNFEVVKKRN